jgi:hypothetical protein
MFVGMDLRVAVGRDLRGAERQEDAQTEAVLRAQVIQKLTSRGAIVDRP